MKSDFRKKLEKMFDQNMDDNKPDAENDDAYGTQTTVRNVCFIPKEGNAVFLNYTYLVSGEYDGDNGIIILGFTTHTVTIEGHGLESTYFAFMEQIPRKVAVTEERYREILDDFDFSIRKIQVKHHD